MRIVIDTNVVISGVFFGAMPRKVIEAVMKRLCERLRKRGDRERI